jgi:hypothetical protein
MKYYVNVELRDYNDRVIGWSSVNLDTNISNENIELCAGIAAHLMVQHHADVRAEQQVRLVQIDQQLANLPNGEN